ncbi:hypothetical protein U14_02274 [Candidatus Moduliflexus flocculans]|uniref:Peptidase M50 domain-containing protein n=1 Tax=Candidatus Moduliflexus flocculans TaxID=1499966 RepID=A0A0S6VTZ9_9BACT|nr:hypothetical protein U14_02274 [Candidatus Moduliflexus flocculans]
MNERFPVEPTPPAQVEYRIHEDGIETIYLSPQPKENIRLHVSLLFLTFLTTTLAGSQGYIDPPSLLVGMTYSVPVLVILLFHEFGHYLTARKYGVDVTLPYVIPGIPFLIGTFGAVIKMRSPLRTKTALFDIGIAGPLAGMAVALPITVVGLLFSRIESFTPSQSLQGLGDSLLFYLLCRIFVGTLQDASHTIILHPTAFAGWVGMLVTMLNLLPVGQLDGGHVTYAILGRQRHLRLGKVILPILLFFGMLPLPYTLYIMLFEAPETAFIHEMKPYGWLNWLLWIGLAGYVISARRQYRWMKNIALPAVLCVGILPFLPALYMQINHTPITAFMKNMTNYGWLGWLLWFWILKRIIKPTHPPIMDEAQPLDRRRMLLGWFALLMFVLIFMPAPFIMNLDLP